MTEVIKSLEALLLICNMENLFNFITKVAQEMGYSGPADDIYKIRDWLRDTHSIHVEVGSIWNEQINTVESYFYTVTAPIHIYHFDPQYCGNGKKHFEMLFEGVSKGLELLKQYNAQKHLEVEDDQLVVAYLKGYSEKKSRSKKQPAYSTNIEEYAYRQGRQGDYIEEGLTDDDIIVLVRNALKKEEQLRLK